MIKSMTGYGRAQDTVCGMNITVEIKSVNHRYFEFSSRLPRTYGFLDEKLKSYVQSRVSRGKTECNVQIESLEDESAIISVNHSLASGYHAALKELAERYGLRDDISVSTLSRYSDIFSVHKAEADEERIWEAVSKVASARRWIHLSKCALQRAKDCARIYSLERIQFSKWLNLSKNARRRPSRNITLSSLQE